MKGYETRWIEWWPKVYSDNWTWRQIIKSLKEKQKTILKMERNMQGLQKFHIIIWCWINEFWEQKKDLQGIGHFCHKRWYNVKYGLGIFKKSTITNNNLHEKRCSRIFTQVSGCTILLNCNLWFGVVKIKTK